MVVDGSSASDESSNNDAPSGTPVEVGPDGDSSVNPGKSSGRGGGPIPLLSDAVVRERIWPLLVSAPSHSLLLQLRHISSP